jgi:hypothetical protein
VLLSWLKRFGMEEASTPMDRTAPGAQNRASSVLSRLSSRLVSASPSSSASSSGGGLEIQFSGSGADSSGGGLYLSSH